MLLICGHDYGLVDDLIDLVVVGLDDTGGRTGPMLAFYHGLEDPALVGAVGEGQR